MQIDLSNRVAIVTGAGRGIGREIARTFAREGVAVVVTDIKQELLDEVSAEWKDNGWKGLQLLCDVRLAADDKAVVEATDKAFGRIDILVNNAGVTTTRPFLDMSEEEWDRVIDTNLTGCARVARAVAQRMRDDKQGGTIVNIASILGMRVAGQVSSYIAAKGGLVHLTKAMALELARYNIRVNALCPGYVETELNADFFASDAGKALVKRIPQRRLGRLADLDGPLLLLASDAGAYMTGSVLAVDGGHLVSSL